jgi:hypothetical protein
MVKVIKILEDMLAPDYAVEVIIGWAQAGLADRFDFCPNNKTCTGNLTHLYNAVLHHLTLFNLPLYPAACHFSRIIANQPKQ